MRSISDFRREPFQRSDWRGVLLGQRLERGFQCGKVMISDVGSIERNEVHGRSIFTVNQNEVARDVHQEERKVLGFDNSWYRVLEFTAGLEEEPSRQWSEIRWQSTATRRRSSQQSSLGLVEVAGAGDRQ